MTDNEIKNKVILMAVGNNIEAKMQKLLGKD